MNSIPKIIHYCWFGKKEKPKNIYKYIKTWQKYLKDYQIIEWNEDNFNLDYCKYVRQAYDNKKYAFVSDVTRLYALKTYGGIYLDTDVEVVKPFDDLLENNLYNCIFGFEEKNYIATSFMAASVNNPFISQFLSLYEKEEFILSDGSVNTVTNVSRLTELLISKGLQRNGEYQILENETAVFSKEYFSPYDYINCINNKTDKTYTIHYFEVSWLPFTVRIKKHFKKVFVLLFGKSKMEKLRNNFIKRN